MRWIKSSVQRFLMSFFVMVKGKGRIDDPPRLGISLRYHYSGTQVQEAVLPQRHWNTSAVQQMFTADMPMRSVFSESTLTSEK